MGLVVPKRTQSTVDRNRLKRRLRELVRLYALPVLSAIDVVILARREAYEASFVQLQGDLLEVVKSLNVR